MLFTQRTAATGRGGTFETCDFSLPPLSGGVAQLLQYSQPLSLVGLVHCMDATAEGAVDVDVARFLPSSAVASKDDKHTVQHTSAQPPPLVGRAYTNEDAYRRVRQLLQQYKSYELIELLHQHAMRHGYATYQDPITNDIVATARTLLVRDAAAHTYVEELKEWPGLQHVPVAERRALEERILHMLRCQHNNERHCPHGTAHKSGYAAGADVGASSSSSRRYVPGSHSPALATLLGLQGDFTQVVVRTGRRGSNHRAANASESSRGKGPVVAVAVASRHEASLDALNGLDGLLLQDARGGDKFTMSLLGEMERNQQRRGTASSTTSVDIAELNSEDDDDYTLSEGSTACEDVSCAQRPGLFTEEPTVATVDADGDQDGEEWPRGGDRGEGPIHNNFSTALSPLLPGYTETTPFSLSELTPEAAEKILSLPSYAIAHEMDLEANTRSRTAYRDPIMGCLVLSSSFLGRFSSCFGESCKHCPHGEVCCRAAVHDDGWDSSSSCGSSSSLDYQADEGDSLMPLAAPVKTSSSSSSPTNANVRGASMHYAGQWRAPAAGVVIQAATIEDMLRCGHQGNHSKRKHANSRPVLSKHYTQQEEEEDYRRRGSTGSDSDSGGSSLRYQVASLDKYSYLEYAGL